MAKVGRIPGKVKNPKNIRKHFYVTEEQSNKLNAIVNNTGEFEAVILRRALDDFFYNYEAKYGVLKVEPNND